jgi:hypothetical protein
MELPVQTLLLVFSLLSLLKMRMMPVHTTELTRRILAILLLSVYMLFSVGIIKATHFCMGRESSVQFFTAESKKCPCSVYAEERDSCCDDEHELLKIDDDHRTIAKASLSIPVWKIERIFTDRLLTDLVFSLEVSLIEQQSEIPPKIPLWKAHNCYVFYDDGLYNQLTV